MLCGHFFLFPQELWGSYDSHFPNEETEARQSSVTCPLVTDHAGPPGVHSL